MIVNMAQFEVGLLFLFAGAVAKRSPGVLGSQRSQDTQSTRAETEGGLGRSQDLEEEEEHEEEQLTEEQLPGRHHRAPARWACQKHLSLVLFTFRTS